MESPPTAAPNAGGVSKDYIFRPVEKSLTQTRYRRKFMSIRHSGPPPRRCTRWRGIRGVISNFGGSRSLMITVTVHLTSTRLVICLLMTRTASHVRCAIVDYSATMRVQNYVGILAVLRWKSCSPLSMHAASLILPRKATFIERSK